MTGGQDVIDRFHRQAVAYSHPKIRQFNERFQLTLGNAPLPFLALDDLHLGTCLALNGHILVDGSRKRRMKIVAHLKGGLIFLGR